MTTERFSKTAGSSVLQGLDDPSMLLVGDTTIPDWVQAPPELGGARHTVKSADTGPCPICKVNAVHLHLGRVIDVETNTRGTEIYLHVAECKVDKVVWYRTTRPARKDPTP